MIINLISQSSNETIVTSKSGDTLTINGIDYDLSPIPDGATLPNAEQATGCKWLCGDIERVNGEIQLTLIHPCPDNAAPEMLMQTQLVLTEDGTIKLPYAVVDVKGGK